MNLVSPEVTVNKSAEHTYNYLTDVKNFEHLMPESTVKFMVLEDDKFLFQLKGMPEIVLKKKEVIPYQKIVLGAAGGKIDFSLTANIDETGENQSKVKLVFNGEFNPMMSMMIKKPITKFIETLAVNMPIAINKEA